MNEENVFLLKNQVFLIVQRQMSRLILEKMSPKDRLLSMIDFNHNLPQEQKQEISKIESQLQRLSDEERQKMLLEIIQSRDMAVLVIELFPKFFLFLPFLSIFLPSFLSIFLSFFLSSLITEERFKKLMSLRVGPTHNLFELLTKILMDLIPLLFKLILLVIKRINNVYVTNHALKLPFFAKCLDEGAQANLIQLRECWYGDLDLNFWTRSHVRLKTYKHLIYDHFWFWLRQKIIHVFQPIHRPRL